MEKLQPLITYSVWYDNLLEEYFALPKEELNNSAKFKEALILEKTVFHDIQADGIINAIQTYRESLKKQFPHLNEQEENNNEISAILAKKTKKTFH